MEGENLLLNPADSQVPAIIILERVDSPQVLDFHTLPSRLDTNVLFRDASMAW